MLTCAIGQGCCSSKRMKSARVTNLRTGLAFAVDVLHAFELGTHFGMKGMCFWLAIVLAPFRFRSWIDRKRMERKCSRPDAFLHLRERLHHFEAHLNSPAVKVKDGSRVGCTCRCSCGPTAPILPKRSASAAMSRGGAGPPTCTASLTTILSAGRGSTMCAPSGWHTTKALPCELRSGKSSGQTGGRCPCQFGHGNDLSKHGAEMNPSGLALLPAALPMDCLFGEPAE